MRVTFHTDNIKSVMLFVHRLTATERASLEPVITDQKLTVFLTLVRTTVEELKRFMQSVPGGEAMAETVKEVSEWIDTMPEGQVLPPDLEPGQGIKLD